MRKINIIFFLAWLIIILFPLNSALAETNCSWRAETILTNPELSTSQTNGGCYSDETRPSSNSGMNCDSVRPDDTSSGYSFTRYICCCKNATTVKEATPPKFEIPQMQVEIPTVKLSKVNCTPDDKGNYDCQVPWIGEYIAGIYNYGLSIAGILAAIVLMAGGLLWLVSGGDASKITQAKDLILGAITGLIILMTSYILLIQINPELVKMKSISISSIKTLESLAESRHGGTAEGYKNGPCATDDELANGVDFYATGYYKPKWEDTDTFRCVIAMQCSCPNGQDTTKNCDQLYGKTFPGYHPCKSFDAKTPYCNMTSSGTAPQDGDIAGPKNCTANLPAGTKVCFKGQTYTIRDTGGGILGKRIDVWSGDNLTKAYAVTGVGKLKKGACN